MPARLVQFKKKKKVVGNVCKCYVSQVCCPCLVCLTLWAAAVCLTVAGYEDVGQASGSGDFCKGGYGTAVAAAASAQSKPASSVTGPGVGECRQIKTKRGKKKTKQTNKTTLSLPSYPYVTNHSYPPLAPGSFASSLIITAPVGRQSDHIICF